MDDAPLTAINDSHRALPNHRLSGLPDLVLAGERGFILAELKTDTGRVSAAQTEWLKACNPHVECYVWRPRDLPEITARLGRNIDRRSG